MAHIPGVLKDSGNQFGTPKPAAIPPQAFASVSPLVRNCVLDWPERPGVPTCGELTEDRVVDSPLRFRYEVEDVVRQEVVVAGSGVH